MSDRTHGVVFEASEEAAVEFFCNIEPTTFLRLVELEEGLWGVYAERWPGYFEKLDEIAMQASLAFGMGLRYCYEGAVGHLCELYEHGERTRSQDADDRSLPGFKKDVFGVFGRGHHLHDVVEEAFRWGNEDWRLEMDETDNKR